MTVILKSEPPSKMKRARNVAFAVAVAVAVRQ
jgi:hypothetical protein